MFAVLRALLRLSGYFLLGVAVVAAVVDGSKSIAAGSFAFTPVGQVWFELSPASLNISQAAIQRHVSPLLWDPVIQTVLGWPVWLALPPLAFLLLILGMRRRPVAALV
ncbi:hypothetical protein [Pannonibacter sp. SL95]|jgi:hypothetical protein|uniref:hypothetical protein n=1 Tax=Pannonibacter sp. SL95 TaxID=2995153 RepID=UPI0022765084|nr:hypothetical protein [Pannonibacter sp. SL95]MCY1707288.1 hypothetical protein [Pannonibacter sp. SL95]